MKFLTLRFVFLVSTCLCFYSCQKEPEPVLPNIIFILTDDQGWGDLGVHGNDTIETPTLDRLKSEGASFTKFYVSPLCAPSRASFLSGKYHLKTGTVSVSQGMERMRASERTIAEILSDKGYATGCFGKWHNGSNYPENPQGQGFNEFVGFTAGHWNNYFDTQLEHNGEMRPTKGYISDVITDESMSFIERNKDQPFFCYIPYNAPHGPFQVPERYFQKYKDKGLKDRLAAIYGMCENVDDNVARILNQLDELALTDNTIVIFATDNGPNGRRYNGAMKGVKGHVDEGGVRVPLFVKWPHKVPAGKEIEALSSHIDLLPTLLDMIGSDIPDGLDGVSLAPTLFNSDHTMPARKIYTHVNFMTNMTPYPGAIRDGRYVLTVKKEGNELYDLTKDPAQKQDLIATDTVVAEALTRQYQSWYEDAISFVTAAPSIPAGFAEYDQVHLTVQEADFTDSLKFKEGHGWANDWLVNWKSDQDRISWNLTVKDSTTYRVLVKYTVPAADLGSQLVVTTGDQAVQATIDKAFDPEYLPSPDRVPRIEVFEKMWATLDLGKIQLVPGANSLQLQASLVSGSQVCEFKEIVLEKD